MDSKLRDHLKAHIKNYYDQRVNKGDGHQTSKPFISYGTAGFRGPASEIEHLFYNIGLISGLKCLHSKGNIGIMITASHNPIQDNGVKLIASNGEMLKTEWEPSVQSFCNTHDLGELLDQLDQLINKYSINIKDKTEAKVLIGMDTRPSSDALATLVKKGLDAWSHLVGYVDLGLLTTPALHFVVAESNMDRSRRISPRGYYNKLIEGFDDISKSNSTGGGYLPYLIIDCANGVGYETLRSLKESNHFIEHLQVELINTGEGILNRLCGADYVKTNKLPPINATRVGERYAALDGDADRVVYFYLEKDSEDKLQLNLLDGDKILALFALYLKGHLEGANLDRDLSLGVVQTAYANGASTEYLTNTLNLKVDFADTGVKNLYKQALNYDVGIFFESNGHGTIWISEKARSLIETSGDTKSDLRKLLKIINNYTGDAISDILVVETILRAFGWDIEDWYSLLYQDRPNSLTKVEVPDRNLIKTTNAGRTCTQPETLQQSIDEIVSRYGPGARSFVRPSGTEDVVRVYAEAKTQKLADQLASEIVIKVREVCDEQKSGS